jgi:hypothetical protein
LSLLLAACPPPRTSKAQAKTVSRSSASSGATKTKSTLMTHVRWAEQDAALVLHDRSDAPHGDEAHAVTVADNEDERARRLAGERDADDHAVAVPLDAVAERS